ncbi:MAG: YfhO family protein, partial [Acidimicrobiales bacterium]
LSASYDPGWTATVDGRSVATQMVAPALVGVRVSAGTHRIVFDYQGFGYYPELGALLVLALLALGWISFSRTSPTHRISRLRSPARASGKD